MNLHSSASPTLLPDGLQTNPAAFSAAGAVPLPAINPAFDEAEAPPTGPSRLQTTEPGAALETMPHLLEHIQSLWLKRDLNTFISRLFLDSRDGSRKGFPEEITQELLLLSRINQQIRIEETARLLEISAAEAKELVARGDQLAMGHTEDIDDVWSQHLIKGIRQRTSAAELSPFIAPRPIHPSKAAATAVPPLSHKLVNIIDERPPLPPSIRIDVTTPQALRSARAGLAEGGIMDKMFFRSLAAELGQLPVGQLVLSSLGNSEKCRWLPSAIRFARTHCSYKRLVLQVDLLTASEALMGRCILEGLDHLVIVLNQASGRWRAHARVVADSDPDYFRREINQLRAFRDHYQRKSGHRCELSVISNTRRSRHTPKDPLGHLENLPGLVRYTPIALPAGISAKDALKRGRCHCLAPFIEAHVRSNGHLVACAQDHSGYSYTADLAQTSFAEAWHNHAFRSIRQRVARGDKPGHFCETCPHRHR